MGDLVRCQFEEPVLLRLAGFNAYEMEDDVTKDLAEFSLANAIYAALIEGHACEISARYVADVVSLFHFDRL